LKEKLALLKNLEDDCASIQRSLAIIQSAQRMVTFYTCDERERLLKEYVSLTALGRTLPDRVSDANSALAIFHQDHPDLALIVDVLLSGESVDLSDLKLNF
jgi:hypothetical protein